MAVKEAEVQPNEVSQMASHFININFDSPNASVMKPYDDLVRLELCKVELNVYKLEGSVRLFDDEGFSVERV